MTQGLFRGKTTVSVRALFVGERIELRTLESSRILPSLPVIVSTGERGYAVLFRYGVVVLFNVNPVEESAFLVDLSHLVKEPYTKIETEELELCIGEARDEQLENNVMYLKDDNPERLQVLADILAKSVVLAFYEVQVSDVFDRIEPLASLLQRKGRGAYKDMELLRHIGGTLLIQLKTVGRVEVGEKPEILWERPELERLYVRLEDEYELSERQLALERKLDLISRTAETLLDLLQHKRSLRVEWYIVILIMVEIILTVYEKYLV